MSTIELNQTSFQEAIDSEKPLIVDFWASWCGPCRSFAPTFEAASEKHTDFVFAKVNTEEQQEIATALKIRSIPTLMIFRERVMLFNEAGALSASQLDDLINQVRDLDMASIHAQIAGQDGQPEA